MGSFPKFLSPFLLCLIFTSFIQTVTGGCALPLNNTFIQAAILEVTTDIMVDSPIRKDSYSNCLSIDQNSPLNYSSLLATITFSIAGENNYVRLALDCLNGAWTVVTRTNRTRFINNDPPIVELFLNANFQRTDCQQCRLNSSTVTTDLYGCVPCNPSCLKEGVNNATGFCYGPLAMECCSYIHNGMCLAECPNNFTHNSSSNCECAPNRSGPDCSICSLTCGNGAVDSTCSFCECDPDYFGSRCEFQHLPCNDNPCENGGVCVDLIGPNNYSCNCINMWRGDNCTDCGVTGCVNGNPNSTCTGCNCVGNWGGNICDTCGLACQNGGSHNLTCNGCNCVGNWGGNDCDTCELAPCQNGGSHNSTCTGCNCVGNWGGNICDTCGLACQNGGSHNSTCTGCNCVGNWGGNICDTCGLACQNGGSHNSTCTGCNCVGNWGGNDCDTCGLACQNGGSHNSTCTGCNCVGNWGGNDCDTCGLACQNGGSHNSTCTGCNCVGNWGGNDCDTCGLAPCQNGGNHNLTCTGCNCVGNWGGNDCDTCGLACQNGGSHNLTCTGCNCVGNWSGNNCSVCSLSDQCQNLALPDQNCSRCECPQDIICSDGRTVNGSCQCESPCDINPCENGGICQANTNGYTCICPSGFTGVNCTMVSPCVPACNPTTQDCKLLNPVNQCRCKPGFIEGLSGDCFNIDECQAFPCSINANCTDTFGSYNCECRDGFEGDGTTCNAINECSVHYPLCGEYPASCVDRVLKYECVCPSGYDAGIDSTQVPLPYCFELSCRAKICTDLNECALPDICGPNQNCVNTEGSYFCQCVQGFFPGNGLCVPIIGQLLCKSMTDGTGTTFPDTAPGVTVKIQCPNTQYGLISRTCLPSCECIADRPQWGYSRVAECISPELDMALNQLRRLSITKSTSQSELESIIQDVWLLAQNSRLQGIDLEVAAIFIQEVEQVIEDWPTPTLSLGISSFDKLLDVADSLLSNSEESWEETDNSTFNFLSIVDTIRKIANRVSIYLYDQGMEYYAFNGTSFSFKLLTWDNYTAEYGVRNLQFPELTNHSISLPFVDSSQVSLPGGRTPQQCRTSLLLLRITSLALLLNAALTGSVRRNQCINLRVQTPSRKYEFQGDYISVAATRGVCQFASINEFSPSNLFVISLPNSPTYHEAGKTFVNTRLESVGQFQKTYTPACTIISSRNDAVVLFECDSSDGYIPLLISPIQPPIPNTTLTLTLLIKCFLAFSALCCFTALILLTLRIFQFRKGLTFVRINVILTLMIAFVVFLVGIDRTEVNWLCTVFGILMQYFAFSTTLWSLLDMINVILVETKYKSVLHDFIFATVGYLLPVVPIPFSVSFNLCSYQRARLYCWPSSETDFNVQFAITVPLYLVLIISIVLCIVMIVNTFQQRTEFRDRTFKRCVHFLNLNVSSCMLPFLLVITWVLATYGFDRDEELIGHQIVFILFCFLDGIFCLLLYCIVSSEKFKFSQEKSATVKVQHGSEPNTIETLIPSKARASLINPLYTEGDERKRASAAYSSHKLPENELEDLEIFIQNQESLLISQN